MKEIFYELIKEAKTGEVIIDEVPFPIAFNTIIYDNEQIKEYNYLDTNLSTLIIKNEQLFLEKLEEYINLELEKNRKHTTICKDVDKNYKKMLMSYCFVNATTEDFLNPIGLLERNIAFLKDKTFKYLNDGIKLNFQEQFNSDIYIRNIEQSVSMETPNKIQIAFSKKINDNEVKYYLPEISYGIKDGECYIYSILSPTIKNPTEEEVDLSKKLNRKFYKINKDVLKQESQEYLDYKNGNSTYYPENISDVSVSAVISLTIFCSLLKQANIKDIKGITYLPLRYLSRHITALKKDDVKKEYLINRNNEIQTNITDKFIRTFKRAAYHIEDMNVVAYPYEYDEYLHVKLGNIKINTNNEFLTQFVTDIETKMK